MLAQDAKIALLPPRPVKLWGRDLATDAPVRGSEASEGARFGLSAAVADHAGPPDIAGIKVGVHDVSWGVGQERTSWTM